MFVSVSTFSTSTSLSPVLTLKVGGGQFQRILDIRGRAATCGVKQNQNGLWKSVLGRNVAKGERHRQNILLLTDDYDIINNADDIVSC